MAPVIKAVTVGLCALALALTLGTTVGQEAQQTSCTPAVVPTPGQEHWRRALTLASTEGLSFTIEDADLFDDGAERSVPRLLWLHTGEIRMIHASSNAHAVAASNDGLTWRVTEDTTPFTGGPPKKVAVVYMADGRYRLLWPQNETRLISAISCDGVSWTLEEGERFRPQSYDANIVSVPDVIHVSGSTWRMYYVGDKFSSTGSNVNNTRSAISDDEGWTWRAEGGPTLTETNVGDPNIHYLSDGGYRMYYLAPGSQLNQAAVKYVDSAAGTSFSFSPPPREVFSGQVIYDPSVVRTPDGSLRLYFFTCTSGEPCAGTPGKRLAVARAADPTPSGFKLFAPLAARNAAPGAR